MSETLYPVFDRATRANPQAVYARMREQQPIYPAVGPGSGHTFWFFTRYEDVVTVLKDQRFGKDVKRGLPPALAQRYIFEDENPAFEAINRHLLNLDAPDHTRLRALVHKAFTPRMVQELQPRIQQIAEALLKDMQGRREADLIEDFAFPLPIIVIADMLGVHPEYRDKFREWTKILLFGDAEDKAVTAVMEFVQYVSDLIEEREREHKPDVLGELVRAEEAGQRLDRLELMAMVFLLLVAGHETTVNLIGNGTLLLLQHPDQMALLRARPELIRPAIEEMLRYNGPVETTTWRWAFEDVTVGGVVIPQGDIVLPSLLAANRDPAVFDNPEVFDITRDPNRHIAFGAGVHYCLGAPLARLEGTIAIQTMLERLPRLALNTDVAALEWNESLLLHGMKALPVTTG
ncbi:MAG: cytochrome P450 [Anaerolineae bacterium]|jgi:cytochrome P450 PksS|nr:cytochrome P450 [Anaerolineae bacterium]